VPEPVSRNRAKIQRTFGSPCRIHDELAVLDHIAHRHGATHPDALHPGGTDLVADPLGRHLAFELREGEKDVQREPPHAGGGVEALRHRDEGHLVAVEDFHQLGEVDERARQPVDLVDHHHIHKPILDVGKETLQGRAFQRATGDAAIIILIAHQHPAFGALARHIGLAGFALGVQRVELLLQPFLGGFAGVDRAAQLANDIVFHADLPPLRLSPKNTQPFHRVPVMARAMAESD
jgi:hypothetical protein